MDRPRPFHEYNLIQDRQIKSVQSPFSHQNQALSDIEKWVKSAPKSNAGGIVVLPTGGGKTFTAIRFLCTSVIAQGYKVLWLAHTHHLLDQAFEAFAKSVATIPEPKPTLSTRIVSGTPGHDPVRKIEPTDDVVVATLQTITKAYDREDHPALKAFLKAAGDKLCVVFDEAHHSPAPSYRRLLKAMRAGHAEMLLLGLTATPTYSDPRKVGWLKELFPQGIIHQSTARNLLADRILARPIFEKMPTEVTPDFDEREYMKWVDTYRDLPEEIIESLASNRERNALIADHYARNRERFGKTIVFAERWHQCEQIAEFLSRHGVRAGSVYSHVDGSPATVEERNARKSDENHVVLKKYRDGELDVLCNVRMLTEGTDVPLTQTVFLTRQTTSQVLLTQMVGRALRGPRAGGTAEAYIVSFEDNWKQKIPWAGFDQLVEGPTGTDGPTRVPRPPLQLISIDLVRRLVDGMNAGVNVSPAPFLKLMPCGWYHVEFQTLVKDSEDIETVRQLVMVFDDQRDGYRRFLEHLQTADLTALGTENVTLADAGPMLADAVARCFTDPGEELTRVEPKDLFHVARHVAQNEGDAPQFHPFDERDGYDLDALANEHIKSNWGPIQVHNALKAEYHRRDRFWIALYPRYELFRTQYDACMNFILNGPATPPLPPLPSSHDRGESDNGEVPQAIKVQVWSRDGWRCLCCGETARRFLQVDHIRPRYFGGTHELENLQTLCRRCNGQKVTATVNFRIHRDHGRGAQPKPFPPLLPPRDDKAGDLEHWERSLRRAVNFFYGAAAVESVRIGRRGRYFHDWHIHLFDGNPPSWLEPHLRQVLERVRSERSAAGFDGPLGIRAIGPDGSEIACFMEDEAGGAVSHFHGIPNGTECRLTVDGQIYPGFLRSGSLKVGNRNPFSSFSAAYQEIAGRRGDAWKAWELRLPGSSEWLRADEVRGRIAKADENGE